MTEIESALTDLLAKTKVTAELGLRLVSASGGSCIVTVPLLPSNERPGGIMAGHVLVAAADVAAWLAIKTLLGLEDASVTSDMHTAFVRGASSAISCRADVIRCGGRLITVGATTSDEGGKTLARHTITYARRSTT